jgi:spore germination protein KC
MANDFQKAAEQVIQAELTQFLLKLQKKDLDPIGFGLRYRSRHWGGDEDWTKWIKMYPKAIFQVNVKVKIQSPGLIN